ncbi:translation initiation factor IF-2 [Parvicella tangerina]|uniref:Translation initiation factor IF-2 n=1 Tax=Parvicella tangerina TaxID=2829795 RepID=A0A916NDT2_9FLAO|nr:translation initiation factor IF-2 [Parvicella tangerina]CAG5085751.1 Translation initiation factor IF-2 [Parvicella tangerina]
MVRRLSKVAREFNVGTSTIVEFLHSKGKEIESSPNTKIDPELYELLQDEFSSEKSVKEKVEEVRSEIKEKAEKTTEEEVQPEEEEPKKDETIKAKANKLSGPSVVGKIDLGKDKKEEEKEEKKEEKKEPEAEEKKAPVKAKEEEKKAEKEEKVEPKEEEKEESEEVETIKAKAEKLSGVTVVRKIDLPVEKKKEKKKPQDNDDSRKKKRKRIKKVNIDEAGRKASQEYKKSKKGKNQKTEISEEEIKKEIQETLARLSNKSKNKGVKLRREKRQAQAEKREEEALQAELDKGKLKLTEFVTVSELATMMDKTPTDIIATLMGIGIFASINQRLDAETLAMVAEEYGFEVEWVSAELTETIPEEEDDPKDLEARPPIVTVMGHVDHGKTSLLDYIRTSDVTEGEAGGITQHIGAYSVTGESGRKITFLDTPGHEAFTAMRARGAQVTDIAIIIIAADDDVMPQTKEAINHAQAAGVPMVFAINKIDKPGANPDKVKEQLSGMNILVEDWGGKYQSQEISAKTGQGVEELLEKVLLEAEMLDLKANPNKNAIGTVIESTLDKGRGYVTTLLVEAGTLKVGDMIIAGTQLGRVKIMHDEHDQVVKEAGPAKPVSILGMQGASNAGDRFHVMTDEKEAKAIVNKRQQLQREQGLRTTKHITLDEIGRRLALGEFQELNLIVKGDVDGSVEALADSMLKLSTEEIQINVIHKAVGQITESDVLLATASDAIIIGFQVRPSAGARKLAEKEEIDIRLYSIIYKAIEEIKEAMEGMLSPDVKEEIIGTAEVRETFKITKVGTIAGCFVTEGKITRNSSIRLIRDGIVVYTGELGSLKRFKDDVKEVTHNYECGLNIEKFNDIKVGDVIEAFEEVEVARKL